MHSRILLYGKKQNLLRAREMELALDGLPAISTTELSCVDVIALVHPIQIVVFCYTVPSKEQKDAAAKVHRYHPDAQVIVITTATSPAPQSRPARVVLAPESRHALSIAVSDVLSSFPVKGGLLVPIQPAARLHR